MTLTRNLVGSAPADRATTRPSLFEHATVFENSRAHAYSTYLFRRIGRASLQVGGPGHELAGGMLRWQRLILVVKKSSSASSSVMMTAAAGAWITVMTFTCRFSEPQCAIVCSFFRPQTDRTKAVCSVLYLYPQSPPVLICHSPLPD